MDLPTHVDPWVRVPARHQRRLPVDERVDVDLGSIQLTVAPAAFELQTLELRLKAQHVSVKSAARGINGRCGTAWRRDLLVDRAPGVTVLATLEIPFGIAMGASRTRLLLEVGRMQTGLQIGAVDRLRGFGRSRQLAELQLLECFLLFGELVGAIELLSAALILGGGVDLLERVD